MEKKNDGKTGDGQTESVQTDTKDMATNFVHGFVVSDEVALVLLEHHQVVEIRTKYHCS